MRYGCRCLWACISSQRTYKGCNPTCPAAGTHPSLELTRRLNSLGRVNSAKRPELMTRGNSHSSQRFRLAELRPVERVESNEYEAEHRHDKTARHIEFIRYVAHELGQNGAP